MKQMRYKVDNNRHVLPPHIMREVSSLVKLREATDYCPIIRLLEVSLSEGLCYNELVVNLVFEYMESDLDMCIRNGNMDHVSIKSYMYQILNGVKWMHSHNIIHRDLKPQNILVSNGLVKIADFGLSRVIDEGCVLSTQVVTQWYRAPEILLQSAYSKAVDVWSCGCIMAEMYLTRPLFGCKLNGEISQLREIFRIIGTPRIEEWPRDSLVVYRQFDNVPSRRWKDILSEICSHGELLLSRMLAFVAPSRITAAQALTNIYFHSLTAKDINANQIVSMAATTPPTTLSPSPSPLSSLSPSPSPDHTHTPLSTVTEGSLDSGIHDI
jgi:serine/threonine protein kinase